MNLVSLFKTKTVVFLFVLLEKAASSVFACNHSMPKVTNPIPDPEAVLS